jgi:hypothetical protein
LGRGRSILECTWECDVNVSIVEEACVRQLMHQVYIVTEAADIEAQQQQVEMFHGTWFETK